MARSHPDGDFIAIAGAALALLAALGFVAFKYHPHRAPPSGADVEIVVPRACVPIRDDGELDEAAWPTAARGGVFVDARGDAARPHTELRFLWDAVGLHVVAYAADGDIGPKDAMTVTFTTEGAPVVVGISPTAATLNGVPLEVGHDVDGTVGEATDDDEEWVTELTIPWSALHVAARSRTRIDVRAVRCDDPKDGGRRCGAMRETALVLE